MNALKNIHTYSDWYSSIRDVFLQLPHSGSRSLILGTIYRPYMTFPISVVKYFFPQNNELMLPFLFWHADLLEHHQYF